MIHGAGINIDYTIGKPFVLHILPRAIAKGKISLKKQIRDKTNSYSSLFY